MGQWYQDVGLRIMASHASAWNFVSHCRDVILRPGAFASLSSGTASISTKSPWESLRAARSSRFMNRMSSRPKTPR
jgi:hypothetical protein